MNEHDPTAGYHRPPEGDGSLSPELDRCERALSEATEILERHVPRDSARVITQHARRSLRTSSEADEFTEELLAKISQASAIFLKPHVRLELLRELRSTLAQLPPDHR